MFQRFSEWTLGRVHFKWAPELIREWLKEGAVIFVTLDTDWLDLCVLNYHLRKERLPAVHWSNALPGVISLGVWKGLGRFFRLLVWYLSFKRLPAPVKRRKDSWFEALERHQPVLLSLPEGERRPLRKGPPSEQWLSDLLSFCQQRKMKVRLVPYYLFWKRTSISKRLTLWSILMGSPHDPRLWRKLIQFFRPAPSFSFATLQEHILESGLDLHLSEIPMLAKQWRRRCIIDLVAARRVLLGPAERQASYLLDHLLSSSEQEQKFLLLAAQEGVPARHVASLVQRYFHEISSRFNFFMIELVSMMLQWMWRLLYTKIDVVSSELESLSRLNQSGSLILVPCHKSHIDYVLMSDLFFRNGIVPPHIAAGINLAFWPFGMLARRCGAFFIRRSFKGKLIYSEVLREYLGALLKDRHNIEFFIEGGRSRTGRMLPPRYGMMKMVFDIYRGEELKDAYFVPVFIGYDQIVEAASYRQELGGGEKKAETGVALLKSVKYVTRKYGKAYVRFGTPQSVKEVMKEFGAESPLLVERAAFKVAQSIQQECVITSSSLLAFSYLNSGWNEVHRDQWLQRAQDLIPFFQKAGGDFDEEMLTHPRVALEKAMKVLLRSKLVLASSSATSKLWVPKKKRVLLNMYKNHIAHFALVEAAALLAERIDKTKVKELTLQIRSVLKFEFFLSRTEDWERQLSLRQGDSFSDEVQNVIVRTFADILEVYAIGLQALIRRKFFYFFEEDFVRLLKLELNAQYRAGKLVFPECAIVSNYKSCLKWLVQAGVLESEERRGRKVYALKEEGDKLKNLLALIGAAYTAVKR